VGWDGGTLLGAVAGNILPAALTDAMGIVLYSMFLAILLPVAKKQRSVLVVILIAAGVSMLLSYGVPVLPSGYGVLLSAIVAATLAAFLFPTPEEKEDAT
jgi:predicted branched-subunit amino acid permease